MNSPNAAAAAKRASGSPSGTSTLDERSPRFAARSCSAARRPARGDLVELDLRVGALAEQRVVGRAVVADDQQPRPHGALGSSTRSRKKSLGRRRPGAAQQRAGAADAVGQRHRHRRRPRRTAAARRRSPGRRRRRARRRRRSSGMASANSTASAFAGLVNASPSGLHSLGLLVERVGDLDQQPGRDRVDARARRAPAAAG